MKTICYLRMLLSLSVVIVLLGVLSMHILCCNLKYQCVGMQGYEWNLLDSFSLDQIQEF